MRGARVSWLAGTVIFVVLLGAACTEEGPIVTTTGDGERPTTTAEAGETTTTGAPETTEAPTTTAGGSETTAPDEEEEGTFPIWVVVLAGVVVIGLLIWAAARGGGGGGGTVAAAPTAVGWKDRGRAGYGASRWLYDALTEGLAIWRGNAQFSGTTTEGATAETGNAATWDQLAGRMNEARDDLYAMEAAAPDPNTAQVARNVVNALNTTRSAVDARAEARYNYRTVEAGSGDDRDQALNEARDREQRAGSNLDAARQSLAEALTALSSVT